MSQPPYPPPGGSEPSEQPGSQGWGQQPDESTQQFGQPAPPTSQFQPGQYGQPGEDQTAQFGQPQYGQPQYGQPQYGQPQYGGPGGPGGPVPPPGGYGTGPGGPSGGGNGKLIAIIAAIVVVLAGAGVGLFFLLKDDDKGGSNVAETSAPTTSDRTTTSSSSSSSGGASPVDCESPSGSGSAGIPDPEDPCDITEDDPDGDFTPLAVDCADEDWQACDDLYWGTSVGSDWEQYGSTCGGRNEETSGGCVDLYEGGGAGGGGGGGGGAIPAATIPATGLGDDPTLQPLAQACYDGSMQSCDELFDQTSSGDPYHAYGDSCAGRQPEGTLQYCTSTFPG